MPLSSMTGFARAAGADEAGGWVWEAKSVNGRGLDLRCRVPAGFDQLEVLARGAAGERFKRGNIALTLTFERPAAGRAHRVNRDLLQRLLALKDEFGAAVAPDAPRLEGLLAVPGVVEAADQAEDEEQRARRERAVGETLRQALDRLDAARREEGARLQPMLAARLDEIAALTGRAAASAAAQPAALRARLAQLVRTLMEAEPALPEERLAHEAALLVGKADVTEELERLHAHLAAARELIADGAAVGRRLDFLCQEFNREANTLCSKSSDVELTRIGLDLKAAIEQLREQVQNVE